MSKRRCSSTALRQILGLQCGFSPHGPSTAWWAVELFRQDGGIGADVPIFASVFSGASAVSRSFGSPQALSRASAPECRIHGYFVGFHRQQHFRFPHWLLARLGDGPPAFGDVSAIRHRCRVGHPRCGHGERSATVPFVSVGWDGVFGEWMGGVAGGVEYHMRASNDRPTLNAPSLNGAAYVPGCSETQVLTP